METFLISLLNTDFVMALIVGAFVTYSVKWLASANGMKWKKWEGLAVTAVKMAETAIPDDTPNKGACRLDAALKLFLQKYEAATGVTPDAGAVAEISSLLANVHDRLDANGTLLEHKPTAAGFVVFHALFALCALFVCVSLLSGCLTRTRCLQQTFDGCVFNVNEGENFENPSYPRSLQIGVQDQQVEGGTDSIASGNRTDPSLQVPMGDSALGAIGQLLGGAVKSYSAKKDDTSATAEPAAQTDCADGSCSDTQ